MNTNIRPRAFTREHIKQAQAINMSDNQSNRMGVIGITIDDVTTVDRDDGIWLTQLDNGEFELQVSITDVSQLIPKDSPIDKEAMERVITLYYTRPPTPMLPSSVSTNLGSLEQEKQTLALTIFFIIDCTGKINSFEIKETIFTNQKAFSYEDVEKILTNPENIPEHKILGNMPKLSQLISKNRGGKSGIVTENGYLDEDGNLIRNNLNAHQLIAEFMILTNNSIANFLAQKKQPAIYRTQDVGIKDFNLAMKNMGHCLVPAEYHSVSKPHVSLGLMNYMHFTSPLRRFVDLVNHRLLKSLINEQLSSYSESELSVICQHINNFTQKFQSDTSTHFTKKRREELANKYGNLDGLNIRELSQDELSELIEYTAVNKTIYKIQSQLKYIIKKLLPKDFYYLWFVAKINDFWNVVNIDTVSILMVKSQLDNSEITYQFEYCELRRIHFCYCYIDNLTTQNPLGDRKKSQAKHKAALASIQGYLEGNLTSKSNDILPVVEDTIDENYQQLSDKDFSKMLDSLVKNKLNHQILLAIKQRIERLSPKDLYKIWFIAKINNFFDYPNLNTISVLLIHSQLTNSVVEYSFDYVSQTKEYHCHCCVDGLTHSVTPSDKKKSKAKQKAALAYIQAYINEQLINFDREIDLPAPEKESLDLDIDNQEQIIIEENDHDSSIDWVSKLNQLQQSSENDQLLYDFKNVDGIFVCMVSFIHENNLFKSTGYGRNKKDAKQMASKICLIQHNLLTENQ